MTNVFLGEIRMFAGNFAPKGNATVSAQQLSIAQNQALFSLLGTTYGGNGVTTFQLPDLRGRVPNSFGTGPGLSNYTQGEMIGTESVTLISTQMPIHTHLVMASATAANTPTPQNTAIFSTVAAPWQSFWTASGQIDGSPTQLNPLTLGGAGGSQPHENRMPCVAINYIIALQGIFPSQN